MDGTSFNDRHNNPIETIVTVESTLNTGLAGVFYLWISLITVCYFLKGKTTYWIQLKKNDKCLYKSLFEDFQVKFSQCRPISKKFRGEQVKSSPKLAK